MFNTLYLLNYNNYYNRLVKKENMLTDYMPYVIATLSATNFNPGDHVSTTHIVNISDDLSPDYAIIVDNQNNIISRWFILDMNRIRGGQYSVSLYRDTVADFYNIIQSAPCFIEKATLNANDPRIFNKEDITFNQIKKEERRLYDKSRCPWIVGYYAKDATDMRGTVPTNTELSTPFIQLSGDITEWEYYKYSNLAGSNKQKFLYNASPGNYQFTIDVKFERLVNGVRFNISASDSSITASDLSSVDSGLTLTTLYGLYDKNYVTNGIKGIQNGLDIVGINTLKADFYNYTGSKTTSEINRLIALSGSSVRDINGVVYNIIVAPKAIEEQQVVPITAGNLFNNMKTIVQKSYITEPSKPLVIGTPNNNAFKLIYNAVDYEIMLIENRQLETVYDMTATKLVTTDAPYNIFAIPYGQITVRLNDGSNPIVTNAQLAVATAMGIQQQQQSKIFDIQVLPYCPVLDYFKNEGEATLTDILQYSLIKSGDKNVGIIFNVPSSRFSFDITHYLGVGSTAIERKVNNQCDKWRLSSPNYSNYFDFSVEMNNGVNYFNVDCDYKPQTPYIHINPNFKNLYGYDDDSPRGLVLGGDFSLPQIGDAWNQYQIQNKNFQNIFDRQIQNMETTHKYQREQDIWNAVAGTLYGGVAGTSTGAILGGGIGAITSGVAGTAASLLGGLRDIKINQALRTEAIDFTKDNFGYQLDNIQALPQTLGKVSALNNNNKLVPVLEYYTCTDIEKQALRDKITYNGMTVMTIGKIADFVKNEVTYIKGQIIRLDNLDEDFHIAKTIANEINKGIFIGGGIQ